MKKKKNIGLIVLLVTLLLVGAITITYRIFKTEGKLTVAEKKYITDSHSKLININVLNDSNVFGKTGKGVYYDFLTAFEKEYELSFNKVAINVDSDISGLSLVKSSKYDEDALLFYTDHYVLVGRTFENIISPKDISGNIGVLTRDVELLNKYLSTYTLTTTNYENRTELETAFTAGTVNWIIVPRIEFADTILSGLYSIDYHFSDIKDYYYLHFSSDSTLNSILKKYFEDWSNESLTETFNKNEYDMFLDKLHITQKELDVINNKEYEYGFVKREPYEVKTGGTYGGIMAMYLNGFSNFTGIEINYNEYKNENKLNNAISKNKVDLYPIYVQNNTNATKIDSNYTVDISIVMSNKDTRVFNSLESLSGHTVYVKNGSFISNYLQDRGIKTINYKNDSEIKRALKNGEIIAMDYLDYLLYKENNANANERFRIKTNQTYNFISNNDTMFNRLLTYYINFTNKDELIYVGLANYHSTVNSGKLIYKVTEYAIILIIAVSIAAYIVYRLGKRVHIKKKIKKSDKMKYIDVLTSVKNRNFLNESIPMWNQNTIYPQAVIVIDLNGIQELNDTYGYTEGDKQIQALANILIKTQLDNTEIMRTDGNEFTVYMVGYNEKQVLSYIKKLSKEMKNLPHDETNGAAIGFSMIEDDVKLIEDAINEATEIMKQNKELMIGEDHEEKI